MTTTNLGIDNFDTITYNGFIFPVIKTKTFNETYVYDDADKTIKYLNIEIAIQFIVTPRDIEYQTDKGPLDNDGTLTPVMDYLRSLLPISGKTLVLTGTGYGDITVNADPETAGTYQDLNNGPKPLKLLVDPLARDQAARVVWIVSTSIPLCYNYERNVSITTLQIAAFSYTIEHGVSDEGMVTRTTAGTMEVVRHAHYDTTVTNREQAYRTEVHNRCQWLKNHKGFKRTQAWGWSEDKRTFSFSIVDEEIPSDNPFYPGTVDVDITHTTKSSLLGTGVASPGAAFKKWGNTLSGSVVVAPNYPRHLGWWTVLDIFLKRVAGLERAVLTSRTGGVDSAAISTRNNSWYITTIELKEHLHKRRIDVTLTWITMTTLSKAFEAQNMFKSATDTTWGDHQRKINPQHHGVRRQTVEFLDSTNVTESVCQQSNPGQSLVSADIPTTIQNPQYKELVFADYDKNGSYVTYQNSFELSEKSGVITHHPTELVDKKSAQDNEGQPQIPDDGSVYAMAKSQGTESVVQVTRSGEYRVTMEGHTIRLAYEPTVPVLISYGGSKAYRKGLNRWKVRQIGTNAELPVFLAMWSVDYALDKKPISDNIVLDVETSGHPALYD